MQCRHQAGGIKTPTTTALWFRTGAMFASQFCRSALASIKLESITVVLLIKENLRYCSEWGGGWSSGPGEGQESTR